MDDERSERGNTGSDVGAGFSAVVSWANQKLYTWGFFECCHNAVVWQN